MKRADPRCILCNGSKRNLLFQQGNWNVYKCLDCGLGFLDPLPDQTELYALYQGVYFQEQYGDSPDPESPEMAKRLVQEEHRIRFFRKFKKRGRLLDMGCGMGFFLQACRNYGYHVEGFDLSADLAAYVYGRLKIPVTIGTIETLHYEKESLDIITMWHFLEHTSDARVYLEKSWEWLKPDGLLVVDVPNYEGTDAQKTWNNWKGWQLPYHLYHFTKQSLDDMLSMHGFRTIRKKDYLSEYVKENLEKIPLIRPFARLVAKCYSGHSVAVVARKDPSCKRSPLRKPLNSVTLHNGFNNSDQVSDL